MLKSRIVAIALIGIILSSSSISVADAYTISINVKEINEKLTKSENTFPQNFKVKIFDGVAGSLFNNNDYTISHKPYKIFLFDGMVANLLYNFNDEPHHNIVDEIMPEPISVYLRDGVGVTINDSGNNNDVRIIKIKQDHDRKAL